MTRVQEPFLSLQMPMLNNPNTDISLVWNVFSKCKDNLENGHRLENLTWRIWYKQEKNIEKLAKQKQPSGLSLGESFSKLQAHTVAKARMEKEMKKIEAVKENCAPPPLSLAMTTNIQKPVFSAQNTPNIVPIVEKESEFEPVPILKKAEKFPKQEKKVSVKSPLHSPNPQASPLPITTVKDRKPTFFISESCTSTLSDESITDDTMTDDDSIYSSEMGSDSDYEENIETSIFTKQKLPSKRPSLLSIALQRDAYRNSQTQLAARNSEACMSGRNANISIGGSRSDAGLCRDLPGFITPSKAINTVPHREHIDSSISPDKDLTESLRMNLGLDHARMFNTVFETGRGKGMSIDQVSTTIW